MSLLSKPLVYYLNNNYLEFFDRKNNVLNRLTFSSDQIKFSEIINRNKFRDEILKFINELKLQKGKAIILMSTELVYLGNIDISGKNEVEEVDKFLASLPIARNNTSTILLKNKSTLRLMTVNRKIYEIIIDALSIHNIEIISVSPTSIFLPKTSDKNFTVQEAKNIKGLKGSLKVYNFLQKTHSSKEDKELTKTNTPKDANQAENKSTIKQIIFLVISLSLLTTSIWYLLLSSGTVSNPWDKKTIPSAPTPVQSAITPSLTPKSSPSIEFLTDKSEIKIQILNGSDTAGQAGKISELLQAIEFENITVGNIDNFDERTTITYNKLLSKDILTEITDAIKTDFPDPTLKEATQTSEFDVQITIGSF